MNPHLSELQPYPFEKLNKLKAEVTANAALSPIVLSVGEPKHPTPDLVTKALCANIKELAFYPTIAGVAELRQAISQWLTKRFSLSANSIDPEKHVLPVNGTREALFAFAQCVVEPGPEALVLMPNPFYQIYEGAVLLAGGKPYYINAGEQSGWNPDFSSVSTDTWRKCQLLYICSPGNPTGSVLSLEQLKRLIALAKRFRFIIASDECYSEIYRDESSPPAGLLEAAASLGDTQFENCIVFHSLSKRSNAPGMRSGFVAGDAKLIERFRLYRTYHGCAMPPPTQAASIAAWSDEKHVEENRQLYRLKFTAVCDILKKVLPLDAPAASFYLWAAVGQDDTIFAKELFRQFNVTVLPGSFLSRHWQGVNPGTGRVRIALVASVEECVEAAERMAKLLSRTTA